MQVSLKKAADISRTVLAASKQIDVSTTVSVSIYGSFDAVQFIQTYPADVTKEFQRKNALIDLHFEIRSLIGKANAETGLNDLLNKKASLEASEQVYSAILTDISNTPYCVPSEIQNRLLMTKDRVIAGTGRGYGVEDTFDVQVFSKIHQNTMIDGLAALKREKAKIVDDIAHINLASKVTLTDAMVTTLREIKIID